jgi:hypothetical protein
MVAVAWSYSLATARTKSGKPAMWVRRLSEAEPTHNDMTRDITPLFRTIPAPAPAGDVRDVAAALCDAEGQEHMVAYNRDRDMEDIHKAEMAYYLAILIRALPAPAPPSQAQQAGVTEAMVEAAMEAMIRAAPLPTQADERRAMRAALIAALPRTARGGRDVSDACPFCHASPEAPLEPEDANSVLTTIYVGPAVWRWFIECGWCHAQGPLAEDATEAVYEWRRAQQGEGE